MRNDRAPDPLLALTAQIVSAHLGQSNVPANNIPTLIQQVYTALRELGSSLEPAQRQAPAVPIKRSVFPDYIVCLEDGKQLKMLKRHLQTAYNMTADQYREKWGLPANYPMTAPTYAQHRSVLAKKIGLGHKPAAAELSADEPRRRGRKASTDE